LVPESTTHTVSESEHTVETRINDDAHSFGTVGHAYERRRNLPGTQRRIDEVSACSSFGCVVRRTNKLGFSTGIQQLQNEISL